MLIKKTFYKLGIKAATQTLFISKGFKYLKVATAHSLHKTIVNINKCAEFKLFKVKVRLIIFSTVGFSRCRNGR